VKHYVSDIMRTLIYPLDANKRYLGEYVDVTGHTHRNFEVTSPTNSYDKTKIEVIVKDATMHHASHVPPKENYIAGNRVMARSSLSPVFRQMLEENKIDSIAKHRQVIAVQEDETIGSAFKKLISNGILSMPVYNGKTLKFDGFLDILDVLSYLTMKLQTPGQGSWWTTWHTVKEFSDTHCIEAVNASGRDPALFAQFDSSVQDVIDNMGTNNIHRIGIIGPEGTLTGILTQSKLLEYLLRYNLLTEMGNIAIMPISQLRLGYRQVYTVSLKSVTIDAFKYLLAMKVSSLAVVDDGKLVGNLSASDLKDIGYDMLLFGKLFLTVEEFLKQKLDGSTMPPPLTVSPSTTMEQLLQMFADYSVHRFFVTDGSTLLGVITPADIFSCFHSKPHIISYE